MPPQGVNCQTRERAFLQGGQTSRTGAHLSGACDGSMIV
jgi:hypothetical protein